MRLRPEKNATLARADTAIVIEGFLRSGNTFSVAAFQIANGPEPARRPAPARRTRTCCGRSGSGCPRSC